MEYVDIHIHGGFGVNFNNCSEDELKDFMKKIKERSVVAFCPTLASDKPENIIKQLDIIRQVQKENPEGAKILGVHLEANFLNPQKCGIHDCENIMEPTVDNWIKYFSKYEDMIKIVTLAPELDKEDKLQKYLRNHSIRIQAGHTVAEDIHLCDSTCHHFNAMPQIWHRKNSVTLKGLTDDDVYTEFIADFAHTNADILRLFLRVKDTEKIILISDSLPITNSELEEIVFCSQKILKDGKNENGVLAGSVKSLDTIVENLISKYIIAEETAHKFAYVNPLKYLGIDRI